MPDPLLPGPFLLERYFAQYEFSAKHLLCCSDVEPLSMKELVAMADAEMGAAWGSLGLGYTESAGLPALRAAVASTFGAAVSAPNCLVLAPEEGIYLGVMAMCGPGDAVIAMEPCYQSLSEVARSRGCTVVPWPAEPAAARGSALRYSRTALAALLAASGGKVAAVVVNFPHNPSAFLPAAAEFEAMVRACEGAGARMFCDEMYRGLEQDAACTLPSACELSSSAVILGGVSKTLSAPGLRIGWLVSRDVAFLDKVQGLKDFTTICSSAPSEVLATIALRSREAILQRNRKIVADNAALFVAFMGKHEGLFLPLEMPVAGSTAFPCLASANVDEYARKLVEAKGVLLLPASAYGSAENRMRIGLGRRDFQEGLEIWAEAIKEGVLS